MLPAERQEVAKRTRRCQGAAPPDHVGTTASGAAAPSRERTTSECSPPPRRRRGRRSGRRSSRASLSRRAEKRHLRLCTYCSPTTIQPARRWGASCAPWSNRKLPYSACAAMPRARRSRSCTCPSVSSMKHPRDSGVWRPSRTAQREARVAHAESERPVSTTRIGEEFSNALRQ